MGIKIIENDNDNMVKQFVIDTEGDLNSLPTTRYSGSFALCISTGDVYVLNTKGEWIKL